MGRALNKILVTGANGQLGRELQRIIAACPALRGRPFVFADSARLDITDAAAVRKAVRGMHALVNCAAYTKVDQAEDDHAAARLVNATAVGNLAAAAREAGALLIHLSTDYVFSGTAHTPYREEDPTAPCNAYGRTKLEGERAIAASGCRALILRTAWLYSGQGHNFVRTMLRLLAEQTHLRVVYDQVGSPTHAADLARAIAALLTDPPEDAQLGTYHYANEGVCSWYDFALAIRNLARLRHCAVEPCRSSAYPTKAARPAYSVLDKEKIRTAFNLRIPHWHESLAALLRQHHPLP